MPGVICAPGNFNVRNNHEKFSLRNRSGCALPVEGDFGLDQLWARWRSSARCGATAQIGTGDRLGDRENEKVACESASFSLSANELETRVRFPSPAPLIINDFTPSPHL